MDDWIIGESLSNATRRCPTTLYCGMCSHSRSSCDTTISITITTTTIILQNNHDRIIIIIIIDNNNSNNSYYGVIVVSKDTSSR